MLISCEGFPAPGYSHDDCEVRRAGRRLSNVLSLHLRSYFGPRAGVKALQGLPTRAGRRVETRLGGRPVEVDIRLAPG